MFHSQVAVYAGKKSEEGCTEFIAEGHFFAVLTAELGLTEEAGKEFLKKLAVHLAHHHIVHLADFEQILLEQLRLANIPTSSSLSACLIKEEKCFLKTIGQGQIFLRRASEFALLIEGDNSASGFFQDNDFFIFTTTDFTQKIADKESLAQSSLDSTPLALRDRLTAQVIEDTTATIALFVALSEHKEEVVPQPPPYLPPVSHDLPATEPPLKPNKLAENIKKLQVYYQRLDKKQKRILIIVSIVFVIFLWSVIVGSQKKANAKVESDLKTKKEIIVEDLNQAQDVAFLNLSRARALITSSKQTLSELKKEVGSTHKKEIADLEKLIQEKESSIFNKEEKPTEAFYDLSVDSPNAKGKKMYLDKDNLAILDPAHGVYTLSLSKKSLDNKNPKEVKKATLVGLSEDSTFFLTDVGMVQITGDKVQKVIAHDADWGNIVDFALYNNNLYLLDPSKNQVYKYSPIEGGYSGKSSYFKSGQDVKLSDARSIAIDSSVYIGLPQKIFKFTAGIAEDFSTSFPSENIDIKKIFTSGDVEKVYAWDKSNGVLYILSKTGSYEREVKNIKLKNVDDFVVSGKYAYLLSGSQILRMSVE